MTRVELVVNGEISEGWANDPETATYPDYFIVDYVRVYQDVDLF